MEDLCRRKGDHVQYVYPELSSLDLNFTRIGGLGLGNMMFPYARAVLYVRDHGATLIWPTWNSIPVGQILRREENLRFYHDLFTHPQGEIDGIPVISGAQKVWLRMAHQKDIVFFRGMEGEFQPLGGRENSQYLYRHFQKILQEKNRPALSFNPGDGIVMHVRLGDFKRVEQVTFEHTSNQGMYFGEGAVTESVEALKAGAANTSIPISWYVMIVQQIRELTGANRPVYLFSDGTDEELAPILQLGNVERRTYGTAIADIMAMSKAKLFIASGSTFSRWVRYFGRMNTITYPGQLKQRLLEVDEDAFEIEVENNIPTDLLNRTNEMKRG